jgi:hypothetical protein
LLDGRDLSGPIEGAFLNDVLGAFAKRRKALRHRLRDLRIDKVVEQQLDDDQERIEVRAELSSRVRIVLSIWSARRVRIWAGEMVKNQGWVWQYDHAGRLVGEADGQTLVEAFERTASVAFGMTPEGTGGLTVIWKPLLARGPQEIR